jgi:ribokinase
MDVIGFGALNLDRLYRVERLAREGEHVRIIEFEEFPGGSAANTIAGLGRLGLKTGFVGAVGNDPEGRVLLDDFEKSGVDTGGISILNDRTGTVIGFVDSKGERTLYPYPGANGKIGFRDELLDYSRNSRFLHLSSFVDEKQFKIQKKLVAILPENVKISFSPGILYSRKGLPALLPIIRKSSVVFMNATEIREVTGKGYKEGSRLLIDNGAERVAVTLGDKGCYLRDRRGEYRAGAKKARVVDTTGAGDAFSSGFLYGLLAGKDIVGSGRLGNIAASLCIQKLGARTGLPTRERMESM